MGKGLQNFKGVLPFFDQSGYKSNLRWQSVNIGLGLGVGL